MKPSTPSLDTLFGKAIELSSAEEREKYLDAACGGDPHLRNQLEKLVADYYRAGDFLEQPAALWEAAPTPPPAEAGQMVDRYRLIEQIGEGGMGVVFVAEQTEPVRRRVALKIIKPGMDTRQVIARFEAERQTLALMDHPHIARVIDGGATDQGRPYFVMELVKGIPITTYCLNANLSLTERLKLFVSVCQAVQHAHQKGIIHRDIKPSNVLVTMLDGQAIVKVIDFGIAKVIHQPLSETAIQTGFSQMVGTPLYMSPEQAALSAVDVDTRSDVYSLGVLLYELLTGTTPFENDTLAKSDWDEMRRIIREVEPPRPSQRISTLKAEGDSTVAGQIALDNRRAQRQLRGELDWIVMKALDKDRARRYQSPAELADDVERYLSGAPVVAMPPSRLYRLRKYARRHAAALITTAVVALSLILGTGISIWQAVDASQARDLAENRLTGEMSARAAEKKANEDAEKARRASDADNAVTKAVKTFLQDELLGLVEPSKQLERGEPADSNIRLKTVLDRAAKRLDERHDYPPRVEAALRHTIGATYEGLSELRAAQPHLERALELYRSELGEENRETLETMRLLAYVYAHRWDLRRAEPLYLLCLENCTRLFGEEDSTTVSTMRNLASLYRDKVEYDKSERLYKKCLEICRRVFGETDHKTLYTMNSLAILYTNTDRYDDAEKLYNQTYELARRVYGEDHAQTLAALSSLAGSCSFRRDFARAEKLYAQCLETRLRVYGEDHLRTLEVMSNAAANYSRQLKHSEAEPLYQRCLAGLRRKYGDDDMNTVSLLWNIASAYSDQLQYEKSDPLFAECLDKCRKDFGPDDPRTLEPERKIGRIFYARREYAKAAPLLEHCLETALRTLGEDDYLTLEAMRNVASLYREMQRPEESLKLFKRCVDICRRVRGDGDFQTITTMNSLAVLHEKQGNYAEAELLYKQCWEGDRRLFGEENEHTLQVMRNIAGIYALQKKFDQAESLYEQCIAITKRAFGDDDAVTLARIEQLADVYALQKKYEQAERLYDQLLETRERKHGPEHVETVRFMNNLAFKYVERQQFDKAEPLLVRCLDVQNSLEPEGSFAITLMQNLADLYTKSGRFERAKPLFDKSLDIRRRTMPLDLVTANNLTNIGIIYRDQKEFEPAEKLLLEALALRRRIHTNEHAETLVALQNVALLYLKFDRHAQAEPLFREVLAARGRTEAGEWRTFETRTLLGETLLGQSKLEEAEPLLLSGYEGMQAEAAKIPADRSDRIPKAIERLVKLYEAKKDEAERAKWQAKLDAARAAANKPAAQTLEP